MFSAVEQQPSIRYLGYSVQLSFYRFPVLLVFIDFVL